MNLRHYQERALSLTRGHATERPIVCLPTGAGKTVVAAEMIKRAAAKGHRVLFIAHRRELILQARQTLARFDVGPLGVIMPGHDYVDCLVQIGSVQTLTRRLDGLSESTPDLVIIDEAHHAVSRSYTRVLDALKPRWLVGLTATPCRLDGRGLGEVFGHIVEPVTVQELVDSGHLVAPRVLAPSTPDLRGVRKVGGDYRGLELASRMRTLTGSSVEHYTKHGQGRPAIAFCTTVQHSLDVTAAFVSAGYRWEHLDGTDHKDHRAETLARLARGELDGVSNCELFGEGIDVPALGVAILLRPTASLTVFRQQIGRIMRPPGPVLVLDHAGNTLTHGLVTDEQKWSLDSKKAAPKATALRTCKRCYAVFSASERICPECGYQNPKIEQTPIIEVDGELVEVKSPKHRKAEYIRMVREAAKMGHRVNSARYRYKEMFGEWPSFYAVERAEYTCRGHKWLWGKCLYCNAREADHADRSADPS